jgi:hypothetical protein
LNQPLRLKPAWLSDIGQSLPIAEGPLPLDAAAPVSAKRELGIAFVTILKGAANPRRINVSVLPPAIVIAGQRRRSELHDYGSKQ